MLPVKLIECHLTSERTKVLAVSTLCNCAGQILCAVNDGVDILKTSGDVEICEVAAGRICDCAVKVINSVRAVLDLLHLALLL